MTSWPTGQFVGVLQVRVGDRPDGAARRGRAVDRGRQRAGAARPDPHHDRGTPGGAGLAAAAPAAGRGAAPDRVELSDDEVEALLDDGTRRLGEAGVGVHWPKSMAGQLTAKAVVGARAGRPPSDLRSVLSADSLLSFDWQVALGGDPLTPAELERPRRGPPARGPAARPVGARRPRGRPPGPAAHDRTGHRAGRPRGRADRLRRGRRRAGGGRRGRRGWRRCATGSPTPTTAPSPIAVPASAAGDPARLPAARPALAAPDDLARPRRLPRRRHGPRQDDHADRAAPAPAGRPGTAGPTLVVCPASLLGNWEREINRFAPGTPVRRFHGRRPRRSDVDGGLRPDHLRHDAPRRRAAGRRSRGALLVADEAQHVKNPLSAHREGAAHASRRGRGSR